jgi:hypothetical protein
MVGLALTASVCRASEFAAQVSAFVGAVSGADGWRVSAPPQVFAGDQIFEFMDGEGEIPRACGFRALAVLGCAHRSGASVQAVLFGMDSSAAAYGLWTMRHGSGGADIALTHAARLAERQLIAWRGSWTLILTAAGDPRPADADLTALARALESAIAEEGRPPDLLARLPAAGIAADSVRAFRAKFALDAVWFKADNVLGLSDATEVVTAEYRRPAGRLLVVRYPSAAEARRVAASWRPDAAKEGVRREGRLLIVAAAADRAGVTELLARAAPAERRVRHGGIW